MQDSLFDDLGDNAPPPAPAPASAKGRAAPNAAATGKVAPVEADAARRELATALPSRLHMGTSSWHFPGWSGLVWDGTYESSVLSKRGLAAYAQHPLLRSVSIDRSFYRPLSASQFADYAMQV